VGAFSIVAVRRTVLSHPRWEMVSNAAVCTGGIGVPSDEPRAQVPETEKQAPVAQGGLEIGIQHHACRRNGEGRLYCRRSGQGS